MGVSLKVQKALWGRSASRCAMPDCKVLLSDDADDQFNPTLIGEVCHIKANSKGGPRFDPTLSETEKNSYRNLILLCCNHHKVIDDPESGETTYPVEALAKMKSDHEKWVVDQLGVDATKQGAEELVAGIIDGWAERCDLDNWRAWTSYLLGGGSPTLARETYDRLNELRTWLLSRAWPTGYSDLERSFSNFLGVLDALFGQFSKYSSDSPEMIFTRTFYKDRIYGDDEYRQRLLAFNNHVDLVQDLTLELTRAANLIIDKIRVSVQKSYRIQEGYLLLESGPNFELKITTFLVRYSPEQASAMKPFVSVESFVDL